MQNSPRRCLTDSEAFSWRRSSYYCRMEAAPRVRARIMPPVNMAWKRCSLICFCHAEMKIWKQATRILELMDSQSRGTYHSMHPRRRRVRAREWSGILRMSGLPTRLGAHRSWKPRPVTFGHTKGRQSQPNAKDSKERQRMKSSSVCESPYRLPPAGLPQSIKDKQRGMNTTSMASFSTKGNMPSP